MNKSNVKHPQMYSPQKNLLTRKSSIARIATCQIQILFQAYDHIVDALILIWTEHLLALAVQSNIRSNITIRFKSWRIVQDYTLEEI